MSRYRIVIDRDRCAGDGLCREEAPDTFEIDRDRRCRVRNAGDDAPEDVLFAAWQCPNDCISVYSAESGQKVWPRVLSREELSAFAWRKTQERDPQAWQLWRDVGGGD